MFVEIILLATGVKVYEIGPRLFVIKSTPGVCKHVFLIWHTVRYTLPNTFHITNTSFPFCSWSSTLLCSN